ncbi:MAG: tripartite tricarboxylate transporter substrate binding protein [Burkholderiales bacterium]|nr:tripartite tricarboxylate transporter substrate binding protein [Burkholderiales bacterium]
MGLKSHNTKGRLTRRHWLQNGVALAAGGLGLGAQAQAFPGRPISLWLPWPAGGATDLTMRLLADLAGKQLGQKVNIENRAGGGGTLVMPVLQQAAPDGYTIAQMPQPVFRAPWMQKLLWDPVRDTTPIIQISGVTFGIVVAAGSTFKSLDDLFAWAKAHPGELTVSTNGVGTTPHMVMDELMAKRGLNYIHVPYKGTAEQMMAVTASQVMVGINSNGFAPFVDNGRLRLLVTFGEHRTKRWPSVPTLKDLGHGIVATSPYGLAGPKGMSPAVVKTLHDAFKAAMFDPAHIAELAKYDQELSYLNSEDYGRAMREIYTAEKRAVERLNLFPHQPGG